jgi:hypothetical protein
MIDPAKDLPAEVADAIVGKELMVHLRKPDEISAFTGRVTAIDAKGITIEVQ